MADKTNPSEDIKDAERPQTKPRTSRFWLQQLMIAEKEHRDFWEAAEKFEKRYLNERININRKNAGKRFQIVYANTETVMSALYAKQAKPDVRQRWSDANDKTARTIADMTEKALSFLQDTTEHDKVNRRAVKDMCLAGRGIVRVCYEAETDEMDGQEIIVRQMIRDEHVYYRNFLHSQAESWSDVWWCGFRHYMTRADLRDQGFDNADDIPLDWTPDLEGHKRDSDVPEDLKRAEVWEIWHKPKRERLWVVKGYPYILRADEDPYQLENFWPLAEPIQGVWTNCTFVPRSPIVEYEDQIDDLDEITDRISRLTKALKRRGAYDAAIKELKRLARANDNEFIPIENFAAFAQAGGFQGAFQTEDLKPAIDVLTGLYAQRQQLIETIYEVTGISDIMRGQSQASETATAQSIKAQYGSARIKERQQDVQRWIRDTMRIKAELIAEHVEPNILMEMTGEQLPSAAELQAQYAQMQMQAMMTGQQPPPPPGEDVLTIDQVIEIMRSDRLRSYHIDIETDSTIFEDAAQEKQDRVELLQSMATFMNNAMPLVQMGGPPMQKLTLAMLEFGVRGFKGSRAMEDALDEMKQEMEEMAQQPPEPPPPDPQEEVEKLKLQGLQMKTEADQAKSQMDMQAKQQQLQADMMKIQAEIEANSIAMQQQLAKQEMDMAAYTRKFELDMERMEEMAERSTEDRD
jgi:hypothetical protein